MPPAWYRNPRPAADRTFAISLDNRHRLSISSHDSLFHTAITGPTGVGKTTVLQHLLLSDAYFGGSILYLDPKGDTDNILARLPEYRVKDTVVLDASAASPVGINILAYRGQRPGQIADTVLSIMKELYKDSWGVYTNDVLSAALHTLVRIKGANLLWLYPLLTDTDFRERITAPVKNDIGLAPFWKMFGELNDPERRKMLAPVQNKLRQLLLHPELRNIFGQSEPRFSLVELFTKRRIVLVPLNKALNGEAGRLVGSVVIGLLWNMALSRAALPENKRHIVSVYVDELPAYVSAISDSFSDTLAQARSLGVGLTVAYQFREQLEKSVRHGIDANARNKICFALAAEDARAMADTSSTLKADDFRGLPKYHVYAQFYQNGNSTGWVSGRTLPMSKPLRDPAELKRKVAALYGKPGKEVEREYKELLASCRDTGGEAASGSVGRRAKA
jgi:type IV secretory pathway TraG/TraD family ATPase VirD4